MAFACGVVPPRFIGAESSLRMYACVFWFFLFFFFISSQLNVFTPKSRDLGSALYVRGIACYTSLSGLVQVL